MVSDQECVSLVESMPNFDYKSYLVALVKDYGLLGAIEYLNNANMHSFDCEQNQPIVDSHKFILIEIVSVAKE